MAVPHRLVAPSSGVFDADPPFVLLNLFRLVGQPPLVEYAVQWFWLETVDQHQRLRVVEAVESVDDVAERFPVDIAHVECLADHTRNCSRPSVGVMPNMLATERGKPNMFGNTDWFTRVQRSGRTMPEAKLTLTIPERAWPGEVSRAYPDARIRILAAMAEPESGVGLAEITCPELDAIIADIRTHDSVDSMEVLQRTTGDCLVQFRTDLPLLLFAAQGSGLPLELPFEIQDGKAAWTLTAAQETISSLGDQLSALGISYTVNYLQQEVGGSEDLLTDRQQSLVVEAIERGYYDTPRECSLTELAEGVGLAKSTTSETLHRAEERVMKEFAATALEHDDAPPMAAQ
jgi:hypothetical protein